MVMFKALIPLKTFFLVKVVQKLYNLVRLLTIYSALKAICLFVHFGVFFRTVRQTMDI